MTTATEPLPTLSPPELDANKDTLAASLSAILQIRGYALAVEQTVLTKITDPPPDWWNELNTNLGVAQKHAQTWTTTLEPAITSTIPQAVITTGARFETAAKDILAILVAAGANPPNPQQHGEIVADLEWMKDHLDENHTNILALKDQFSKFQIDSGTDYTTLSTGASSIQKALEVDQGVITNLKSDIVTAEAEIKADNMVIGASAMAGGVGLFVGVGLLGFGAAAGPAAPFLIGAGVFVMVGSIVEMATVIAIYEKKIAAAQNRMNHDQSQLQLEEQQAASLTVLEHTIDNLVNLNKAMGQALTEIADWWAGVKTKIELVIADVQNAQLDTDMGYWHALKLDVETAQTDWKSFAEYATNMQSMASGVQMKPVDVAPGK